VQQGINENVENDGIDEFQEHVVDDEQVMNFVFK
jgi:hypothetical protein